MAEAQQDRLASALPAKAFPGAAFGIPAALFVSLLAFLAAYVLQKPVAAFAVCAALSAGVVLAWLMIRPMRLVRTLFILLPFHIMFMVVLFGLLGLPESIVRALASWKEGVLFVFLLSVIAWIAFSGKRRFRVGPTEAFALVFILQVLVYVAIAPLLGSEIGLVGRLYDVRDSTLLLGCYFLGRAIRLDPDELDRLLKLVVTVGAVTVGLGLLEWFLLPDQFFVLLGVSSYFKDFLGVNYAADDWGQGLPSNFWTYMGALGYVRRSVSVYMSSQGYAVTFLILIPIATYFVLYARTRRKVWGLVFQWAGLLSSITRATILICGMLFFLMAKLSGRDSWFKKGVLWGIALAIGGMVFSQGVRTLVWETLTFKSDSSISHLSSWTTSIDPILEKPLFGHGLSEAGQNSKRFGGKNVGEESMELRLIGELGAFGFLVYMGFWFAYMLEAYAVKRSAWAQERIKGMSVMAIAICVGFLLNGLAADLLSSQYTNFATGILLGLIRTTTQAASAGSAAPAPFPT